MPKRILTKSSKLFNKTRQPKGGLSVSFDWDSFTTTICQALENCEAIAGKLVRVTKN